MVELTSCVVVRLITLPLLVQSIVELTSYAYAVHTKHVSIPPSALQCNLQCLYLRSEVSANNLHL
jgi:hypothetical protein